MLSARKSSSSSASTSNRCKYGHRPGHIVSGKYGRLHEVHSSDLEPSRTRRIRERINGVLLGPKTDSEWFVHWFGIRRTAHVPSIKIRNEPEKTPLPNYQLEALRKDHKKLYIGDSNALRNYVDNYYSNLNAKMPADPTIPAEERPTKQTKITPEKPTAEAPKDIPKASSSTTSSAAAAVEAVNLYERVSQSVADRINNSEHESQGFSTGESMHQRCRVLLWRAFSAYQ